jgi:hypothetical protein
MQDSSCRKRNDGADEQREERTAMKPLGMYVLLSALVGLFAGEASAQSQSNVDSCMEVLRLGISNKMKFETSSTNQEYNRSAFCQSNAEQMLHESRNASGGNSFSLGLPGLFSFQLGGGSRDKSLKQAKAVQSAFCDDKTNSALRSSDSYLEMELIDPGPFNAFSECLSTIRQGLQAKEWTHGDNIKTMEISYHLVHASDTPAVVRSIYILPEDGAKCFFTNAEQLPFQMIHGESYLLKCERQPGFTKSLVVAGVETNRGPVELRFDPMEEEKAMTWSFHQDCNCRGAPFAGLINVWLEEQSSRLSWGPFPFSKLSNEERREKENLSCAYRKTAQATINCMPGQMICYHAANESGDRKWGMGVGGNTLGNGYCVSCNADTVEVQLDCPWSYQEQKKMNEILDLAEKIIPKG